MLDTDGRSPKPFSRRSRYILVIEGNAVELFTTAMLLQRFSYPVFTARNARQALDLVTVSMPALVIADTALSGMSAFEFLHVLNNNPHTRDIPVILLVPGTDADVQNEDFEDEGIVCLAKPLDMEELYREVQLFMESTPRQNLRVPTELPVVVNATPLDHERGECATCISVHGIYIRTLQQHERGAQLSLQVIAGDRTVKAEGIVLYARGSDDGRFGEPGMALKFTRISAEDRDFIRQFVRNEVKKGLVEQVTPPKGA